MATKTYVEDAGLDSEENFLPDAGLRLRAGRWPRVALALASSIGIVAAVALFSRTPAPELVSPSSVVGLAASEYADLGSGKCILEGGGDPKNSWKCGDVKKMCDDDSDCVGYSKATTTDCGLLWKSGPIKGGGSPWGGCSCLRKKGKGADGQPVVAEDEGKPETKYISNYYIKTGQCPPNEIIRDYSECVNKFQEIAPEKAYPPSNRKVDSMFNAGCMVDIGVKFNERADLDDGWDFKQFVCKKADADMPDFEGMRKDQDKLFWYCLKKGNGYGDFKQCLNEITHDEHAR